MKVAISYTETSVAHKKKILMLTEKLAESGINFTIDLYDLNIGDDVYYFMEQLIMSEEHNYIFVICNQEYKKRADNNKGGVGFEVRLLRYLKNFTNKIIPIIFEHDEEENPIRPNFLLPDKYVDLTMDNDFTSENFKYLINWLNGKKPEKPQIIPKIDFGNFSENPDFEGLSEINNIKSTLKRKKYLSTRSKDIVSKIAKLFEQSKFKDSSAVLPILLQCISGEGKTTIASEFAHKYGLQFFATFYIDCQYSIGNQYADFASSDFLNIAIPITIQKEKETTFKIEKVKDYINTNPVLLIFDNLEKLDAVEEYIPKAGKSRSILLTNDLSIKTPYFFKIEVPKLSNSDALEILFIGLDPSTIDKSTGNEIISLLGYLPFAIELANSILLDDIIPLTCFLSYLKQESIKWEELRRQDGLNFIHSASTIIALIEKKFDIIKGNNESNELVKTILSYIGCMGIANDKLKIDEIQKEVKTPEDDKLFIVKFNRARKTILQLGINSNDNEFIVHTLTMEYIKLFLIQRNVLLGYIDNKLRDISKSINLIIQLGMWSSTDDILNKANALILHFTNSFPLQNRDNVNIITDILYSFCCKLNFLEKKDDCINYANIGLSVCENDKHFHFFELRNNDLLAWKAICLHKKERYDEALDIYEGILEKSGLRDPKMFIDLLMYTGDIYRLKKKKEDAQRYYETAIHFVEDLCKKNNLLSEMQYQIEKAKILTYFDWFYTEFEMFTEKEQNRKILDALMNTNIKNCNATTQIEDFPGKTYLIKDSFEIFQLTRLNNNTYKPVVYGFGVRLVRDLDL